MSGHAVKDVQCVNDQYITIVCIMMQKGTVWKAREISECVCPCKKKPDARKEYKSFGKIRENRNGILRKGLKVSLLCRCGSDRGLE